MEIELCGICVPREESDMDVGADHGECICKLGHLGAHVFKNSRGQLIAWEDDFECGCCEPEADGHCITYWVLTAEEAVEYTARRA